MRVLKWTAAFGLAVLAALAIMAARLPDGSDVSRGTAVIKVIVGGGHGSAVHIGHGYVLTAAHVVGTETTVKLKSSMGDVQTGEVLWFNKDYDVAMVRASRPDRFESSPLSCREPKPGEYIRAEGNPAGMEFVAVYGRVSGTARKFAHWRNVIVTDITVVPGQSGGPLYDNDGNVVGLTVGVMVAPVSMFSASLVGIGYAVPADTVCTLMARSS